VGTAISTISATVSGTVSSWSIVPTLSAGLTFNTNTGAITGTPSAAISNTTYTISATNAGGTGTATITILVNAAVVTPTTPAAPVISYANNVNTFTVGTAISTISSTVSGTVTSWAINPTLSAGLTFNTSTGAITGTPSAAISNTTYTISATNAGGTGTATITIQVNAAVVTPTVPFVAPITGTSLICGMNATSQLLNATNGGVWSSSKPNIAVVSASGLVTGIASTSDTLTIYYTITVNGVSNTASFKMNYVANPTPGIKMTPIDLVQNESTLISARDIGISYAWSSNANTNQILSSLNTRTTYATIADPVIFTIKITLSNGCSTTDTLEARVFKEKAIYVPNTFTPNGDGINDIFKLNPVGINQLYTFSIYNSRGAKMFETNNMYEGWDGTLNGVLQPVSSYVWYIDALDKKGNKIKEYGTITLLR
jgi:gliding motility-associated-like protein